jgi:hypothetical protein
MVYSGPGFLAVVCIGSSTFPICNLSIFLSQSSCVWPFELSDGRGTSVGGSGSAYGSVCILGLPDSHPLVKSTDPDPDTSIKQN